MDQLEPSLLRYVWRHSRREQVWVGIIILLSMPTYFLSLDLPKRIVNGPIQGNGFENPGDTAPFLQFDVPFSEWLTGEPIELFGGFELERIPFLMALAVSFLGFVLANGLFKLYINTYKGRLGERVLRRLRFDLFDRVLRYPLARYRRTKASEIASMIKDEVEPMGQFVGDAFTQPLYLGGQAITALTFIFLQNVWLGSVTLVIVLFQAWLIPILRRRLVVLGKMRQIEARAFAGRIGEVVEGIQEVHANDTSNYERGTIASNLARQYDIRFELYQRKFSVKFLNNLLIQFLAFVFYAAGGYLAIRGTLDIGQLVAVIAAYKDLPDPIRGLIDYDQQRLVVDARYNQIVEQFPDDDLQPRQRQAVPSAPPPPLEQGFDVEGLEVIDDSGTRLIESASARIGVGERVAAIGGVNAGANTLLEACAGLVRPSAGHVHLDGRPVTDWPESVTGRRLGYVDGTTFFPQSTVFEALTYVLKNQPLAGGEASRGKRDAYVAEARRAGVSEFSEDQRWTDGARIRADDEQALLERIEDVLDVVDLTEDVRALGLRGIFSPEQHPDIAEKLLGVRRTFREQLAGLGFAEIVEPFDPERYNSQSSIGENILFGTALLPAYRPEQLASNTLVRQVLRDEGLEERLFELGREVAQTTVELFGDLPRDNPFFDRLTYMDPDALPAYRAALGRIANQSYQQVSAEDQVMILRLPFAYVETRNRLGLLDDALRADILRARAALRRRLEDLEPAPIAFYDPDRYNPNANVIDNVLLGRVATGVAGAQERVTEAIRSLLDKLGLTQSLLTVGLDFNMGSGGKRLSETQRQKLHLARALLKEPDILLVNQGLNKLDGRAQKVILDRVLERSTGHHGHRFGIVWVPVNPALAESFDRVLVFKGGRLVADGPPDALAAGDDTYRELVR